MITAFARQIIVLYAALKIFGCFIGKLDSNFSSIRRKRIQRPGPSAHKCQIHLCKLELACLSGHEGMVISAQNSQIHLPFICHLLWHLKLNLYAFFRMSYLIISIIQLYSVSYDEKAFTFISMFPSTDFQMIFS